MTAQFRIAVIPGDGIGQEVTAAAVEVLDAVVPAGVLDLTYLPWGSDHYKRTGAMIEAGGVERLREFDAILFGASGDPEVPDHISLRGLRLAICQGLDQYVGYRPSKRMPGVPSPLRTDDSFDFLIVRENTQGEYSGAGGRIHRGQRTETATQTAIFTRVGIERVVDYAFEQATARRQKLTSITKSNAQEFGLGLWDEVVAQRAAAHPDVEVHVLLVDAAAARLLLAPQEFDVIVASNLFGDILSDLGGALMGSLGLAASGNIDPTRTRPSMFEPVHGSAPDIVGRGIANPVGAIGSAALMLDQLGLESQAAEISLAVEEVLRRGVCTPDIGGTASTNEVVAAITAQLKERKDGTTQAA
jgi:tartrate dehydrogenase/decarboxylase / D-malate dehydrogenase